MNAGSVKISVRLGDELLEMLRDEVARLDDNPITSRKWTMSEFVVQAIVDKINHNNRSRAIDARLIQQKVDEYRPRLVEEV